jgi:predicted dehydrogenase
MIKVGLYGSGSRTKALLDSLIHDDFYKVHAVYDLNQDSAAALAAKYGGTVCSNVDELVSFRGVDAFIVSLSPFAHAEALRKTIPIGKPIFVEKPVSFSFEEVNELADLAEKYNVPVQVGFMRRYLPESLNAFDYIRGNDPGKLLCVDCNWFHHGATEMNFNLYHHPDNFRLKVSQIPFHCCHMLDVMLLMGGKVKSVSSQLIKVTERPYPSPDDVIANIEFENGASGRFHYSSMVYYGECSYRFHAENYSLKMDVGPVQAVEIYRRPRFKTSELGKSPETCLDCGKFNETYETFCRPQITTFSQGMILATENIMYDFVQMVRDGIKPQADLRTAARVQGLAEAIETSGKLKYPIDFSPDGLPLIK